MKVVWVSERHAQWARALGWIAVTLAVAAALPWINALFGFGMRDSLGIGAWMSLAALVLSLAALALNSRAPRPRSWVPRIALWMAISIALSYGALLFLLAGLSSMH